MIITLCGFMGCGKSTLGRALSKDLYLDYIDLDDFLAEKLHLPINEYFQKYGEARFREMEADALRTIVEDSVGKKDLIISLGGGTPTFQQSAKIIKESTYCIYLKTENSILYRRLSKNGSKRPLLGNRVGKSLMEYIEELVSERESCYNDVSKITLNCTDCSLVNLTGQLSRIIGNLI